MLGLTIAASRFSEFLSPISHSFALIFPTPSYLHWWLADVACYRVVAQHSYQVRLVPVPPLVPPHSTLWGMEWMPCGSRGCHMEVLILQAAATGLPLSAFVAWVPLDCRAALDNDRLPQGHYCCILPPPGALRTHEESPESGMRWWCRPCLVEVGVGVGSRD